MTKHMKPRIPTDADLRGNPMIGGTGGMRMAGISPDELDGLAGETTLEGDVGNDTTPAGGIDKASRHDRRKPDQK